MRSSKLILLPQWHANTATFLIRGTDCVKITRLNFHSSFVIFVKPLTFSILRLLSDGNFHSGEELAQQLNVSRGSVWNALKTLREIDVNVYSVHGRGYCLATPMKWLDKQQILTALGSKVEVFDLEVLDVVASTNSMLMQRASLGASHGSCVVAEMQTHGRGRRGRCWHANLGGSLTFSVLWRFNQGAGHLSGLSLAIGVALVRALREAGVMNASLKWPNDVVHQYHKLAGILIELQGDVLGPSAVVIGIGINLQLGEHTKANIDQAVVDTFSVVGGRIDRNLLLAGILSQLSDVLEIFDKHGFRALRNEWVANHAYHNRPVRLLMPGGEVKEGHVLDVAEDGSLVVKTELGPQKFTNGEISLRGVI